MRLVRFSLGYTCLAVRLPRGRRGRLGDRAQVRLVRFRFGFGLRNGVLCGFRVAGEGGWETGHRCG